MYQMWDIDFANWETLQSLLQKINKFPPCCAFFDPGKSGPPLNLSLGELAKLKNLKTESPTTICQNSTMLYNLQKKGLKLYLPILIYLIIFLLIYKTIF